MNIEDVLLLLAPGSLVLIFLMYRFASNLGSITAKLDKALSNYPDIKPLFPDRMPWGEFADFSRNLEEFLIHNKEAQITLNLEKEVLNSLLNAFRDGVFCVNREGIVWYRNPSLDSGLVEEHALGKIYFKALRNNDVLEYVHQVLRLEFGESQETSSERKEPVAFSSIQFKAARHYYKIKAYPVHLKDELEMYLFIVQDITDEQNVQKLRQEFLQNASHELKTPITSIRGYAETIQSRESVGPTAKFLDAIMRNVYRMERLIEDMVSISSVESGEYPFHPENVPLSRYLDGIGKLVSGTLERKNQSLEMDFQEDTVLTADPLLLEYVLVNLISNASRYSPDDTMIRASFRCRKNDEAIISVTDRGPGIPIKFRDKIFERFFRIDKNRSRDEGGDWSWSFHCATYCALARGQCLGGRR